MTDEDEAFNEIEKRSKVKQENIRSLNRKRQILSTNPYRNQVIEEVAKEIEKLTGFGHDTIDGLTIYIRNMKS
jgi:hypothetical protein